MRQRITWKPMDRLKTLLRRKFVQDTIVLQIGSAIRVGVNFLASIMIARLMGPTAYGEWALVASFFAIWQSFNLTGVVASTLTRLSAAVGANDQQEALNLLAFYIRITLTWALPCITLMVLVGIPLASYLYDTQVTLLSPPGFPITLSRPDPLIGIMAAVYSVILITEGFYNMAVTALQSRREMRLVALLLDVNAITLAICVIGVLLISPTMPGMVFGRLLYSSLTMLIALWLYSRRRTRGTLTYPTLTAILTYAPRVPVRPYWRFGFTIALDRSVANLFLQIPMQLVGIYGDKAAAGYLQLGLRAIQLPNNLTSAIFDNMQAVIPQAIGRRDYARLWHNFKRALLVLAAGSLAIYALVALVVTVAGPFLVTLLYGSDWLPALPMIGALTIFGAVTTIGGVFGPLYRSLLLMRSAIIVKVIALLLALLPGVWLVSENAALGGAWFINLAFTLSVGLTAIVTLPALRYLAITQPQNP